MISIRAIMTIEFEQNEWQERVIIKLRWNEPYLELWWKMIANINIIQTNLLDQYISICIYISNLRLSIEESFDYMNTSPAI